MKSFILVFTFISVVAFAGCATSGGGGGPASSDAGSKLNDTDFKKTGVLETYGKRN